MIHLSHVTSVLCQHIVYGLGSWVPKYNIKAVDPFLSAPENNQQRDINAGGGRLGQPVELWGDCVPT